MKKFFKVLLFCIAVVLFFPFSLFFLIFAFGGKSYYQKKRNKKIYGRSYAFNSFDED